MLFLSKSVKTYIKALFELSWVNIKLKILNKIVLSDSIWQYLLHGLTYARSDFVFPPYVASSPSMLSTVLSQQIQIYSHYIQDNSMCFDIISRVFYMSIPRTPPRIYGPINYSATTRNMMDNKQ